MNIPRNNPEHIILRFFAHRLPLDILGVEYVTSPKKI